jgi:hypothetical protein
MKLRATKPVLEPNRFRALIFGNKGAGKTHFAVSIPSVYYIDTEGVLKYEKFVEMLKKNDSVSIALYELTEIISEVKALLTLPHDYKTLVIDSITFPYNLLSHSEAERLIKKNPHTEGTEFGANMAKAKRLTFHLATLLTRLDMNVIVTAHEKTKYENNVEIGKEPDINEKMEYALGTSINLRMFGDSRKAYMVKSRYDELKNRDLIDFDNGYDAIKQRFGEEIFLRKSEIEILATKEQIGEFNRLVMTINYPQENIQKWLLNKKSHSIDEVNTVDIQRFIDHLKSKITGEVINVV